MKELPKGWVSASLEDLIHPKSERALPSDHPDAEYIGLEHVQSHTNKIIESAKASTVNSSCASFSAGDVLYGRMRPYLNKVVRPKFGGLASAEFIVFSQSTAFDLDFLLKRISANDFLQFACSQYEGDRPRVKFEQLGKFQVNLPPRAEQTRIVAKLEELLTDLDHGVAELQAAQKKLGQYRQSLFKAAVEGQLTAHWRAQQQQQATACGQAPETGAQLLARILTERRQRWEAKQRAKFAEQGKTPPKNWQSKYPEPVQPDTTGLPKLPQGWVWASVDQLSELITSGSRGWADYYSNSGATFIRSQNINKDFLDLTDIAYVMPPEGGEGSRTKVEIHDLLLTITGANVGKAAHVKSALAEAYVSQHVALIRPVDKSISIFLHLYLTAEAGGRGQLNKWAYGAGKPGLNLQQVGSVLLPICSSHEREELEKILMTQFTAIDEQLISITQALKQATAQRQNILRAAFAGELVPQDPNDEPASVLLERIRAEQRAAQAAAAGKKPKTAPRKKAQP